MPTFLLHNRLVKLNAVEPKNPGFVLLHRLSASSETDRKISAQCSAVYKEGGVMGVQAVASRTWVALS